MPGRLWRSYYGRIRHSKFDPSSVIGAALRCRQTPTIIRIRAADAVLRAGHHVQAAVDESAQEFVDIGATPGFQAEKRNVCMQYRALFQDAIQISLLRVFSEMLKVQRLIY